MRKLNLTSLKLQEMSSNEMKNIDGGHGDDMMVGDYKKWGPEANPTTTTSKEKSEPSDVDMMIKWLFLVMAQNQ